MWRWTHWAHQPRDCIECIERTDSPDQHTSNITHQRILTSQWRIECMWSYAWHTMMHTWCRHRAVLHTPAHQHHLPACMPYSIIIQPVIEWLWDADIQSKIILSRDVMHYCNHDSRLQLWPAVLAIVSTLLALMHWVMHTHISYMSTIWDTCTCT